MPDGISDGILDLETLESLPPDMNMTYPAGDLALLIRMEVRRRLDKPDVTWIGTSRAERETPESARNLRRLAKEWHEQLEEGRRPEVRVKKKTDAKNSDWLFSQEDCRRYARRRGFEEQMEEARADMATENDRPSGPSSAPSSTNGRGPDGDPVDEEMDLDQRLAVAGIG